MQFEPATFRAYATVGPGGADPASPYDAEDAIYSAARLLCADGGGTPGLLNAAIFAYNHSAAYVALVLAYASVYEQESGTTLPTDRRVGANSRDRSRFGGRRRRRGLFGHAVRLGRRAAGGRIRLLGPGPMGLRRGRHLPAAGRPGPVRRRAPSPGRSHAVPGRSGVLRIRAGRGRARRHLRRRWRDDRCAVHRRRCPVRPRRQRVARLRGRHAARGSRSLHGRRDPRIHRGRRRSAVA